MNAARLGWLALVLTAAAGVLPAQLQLTLQWQLPRDGLRFGDEVVFDVLRSWPADTTPEPFGEAALVPLAPTLVEVVALDATHERRRYRAVVFAVGEVVLPPLVLRARRRDGTVLATSHTPPPLSVGSLLGEPAGEFEWLDAFDAPRPSHPLPWLAAAALVVMLGGFWWHQRRAPAAQTSALPPSPASIAAAALRALLLPGPAASPAAVQAFYVQLAAIVREHAGRGLPVPAATRTSEQLFAVAGAGAASLRECLSACDAVKFAAHHPGPAEPAAAQQAAIAFVAAAVGMNAIVELGCRWRDPAWFWLLLLLVPLVVRCRRGLSLPFVAPGDGARLPRSWRSRLIGLPAGLSLFAVALAIAALARPVQRLPAPPERLVRDVVFCLDRSSSMAAQDLQPGRTRLAVAIDVATHLLAVRADDRFGCVVFARYPDLVCPPTLDHDAARELLGGITLVAADGPEDATGIGAAVATAAEALSRSPLPGRVIVLLTDGEENVATRDSPDQIAPLHAAQFCAQLGIRVHTIVVGRGQRTADGHLLPPDTSVVQQLAAGTGGRFFTAPDQAALQAVGRAIDAVEAMQFAEPRVVVREWFPAALALAVALLGAAHLLRRTWLQGLP